MDELITVIMKLSTCLSVWVQRGKSQRIGGQFPLVCLQFVLLSFLVSKNVFEFFLLAPKMYSMHMCTLGIIYIDGG